MGSIQKDSLEEEEGSQLQLSTFDKSFPNFDMSGMIEFGLDGLNEQEYLFAPEDLLLSAVNNAESSENILTEIGSNNPWDLITFNGTTPSIEAPQGQSSAEATSAVSGQTNDANPVGNINMANCSSSNTNRNNPPCVLVYNNNAICTGNNNNILATTTTFTPGNITGTGSNALNQQMDNGAEGQEQVKVTEIRDTSSGSAKLTTVAITQNPPKSPSPPGPAPKRRYTRKTKQETKEVTVTVRDAKPTRSSKRSNKTANDQKSTDPTTTIHYPPVGSSSASGVTITQVPMTGNGIGVPSSGNSYQIQGQHNIGSNPQLITLTPFQIQNADRSTYFIRKGNPTVAQELQAARSNNGFQISTPPNGYQQGGDLIRKQNAVGNYMNLVQQSNGDLDRLVSSKISDISGSKKPTVSPSVIKQNMGLYNQLTAPKKQGSFEGPKSSPARWMQYPNPTTNSITITASGSDAYQQGRPSAAAGYPGFIDNSSGRNVNEQNSTLGSCSEGVGNEKLSFGNGNGIYGQQQQQTRGGEGAVTGNTNAASASTSSAMNFGGGYSGNQGEAETNKGESAGSIEIFANRILMKKHYQLVTKVHEYKKKIVNLENAVYSWQARCNYLVKNNRWVYFRWRRAIEENEMFRISLEQMKLIMQSSGSRRVANQMLFDIQTFHDAACGGVIGPEFSGMPDVVGPELLEATLDSKYPTRPETHEDLLKKVAFGYKLNKDEVMRLKQWEAADRRQGLSPSATASKRPAEDELFAQAQTKTLRTGLGTESHFGAQSASNTNEEREIRNWNYQQEVGNSPMARPVSASLGKDPSGGDDNLQGVQGQGQSPTGPSGDESENSKALVTLSPPSDPDSGKTSPGEAAANEGNSLMAELDSIRQDQDQADSNMSAQNDMPNLSLVTVKQEIFESLD